MGKRVSDCGGGTEMRYKRTAYIEPTWFEENFDSRAAAELLLSGLDSFPTYDYMDKELFATCASKPMVCSGRDCIVHKGQIRITQTRFDLNHRWEIWFKPESYCLECAPADLVNSYGDIRVDRLPPEAKPLLESVCAAASKERVFLKGYGDKGETTVEDAATVMDDDELRAHKRVRKRYLAEMKLAFENGRSIPEKCAKYRCTDEAFLSDEPQGVGVPLGEKHDPHKAFEQELDPYVLNNWVVVKY